MDRPQKVIAVVTAVACSFAEKELIYSIISENLKQGYRTVIFSNLYNQSETERELLPEQLIYDLILCEGISGIILLSESFVEASLRKKIADLLRKSNVPVVVAGSMLEEFSIPGFVNVNTSDSDDLEALTDHLIEEHGFTDITMLTGFEKIALSMQRLEGYQKSMRKHGLTVRDEQVHFGNFWMTSGIALADRYYSGELTLPQAIICANDCMAYGMLSRFTEHGIKVPQDVTVVSYEYSNMRIYYSPKLTSFRRNRTELGRVAAQHLHAMIQGNPLPTPVTPKGQLIRGSSCPCPPNDALSYEEMKYVETQRSYERFHLCSTMEHKLTVCKNMDEYIKILGETQWMLRNCSNSYLCLFTNWFDASDSPSESMMCRSVINFTGTSDFEIPSNSLIQLLENIRDAAAMYFLPIFSGEKLFGYIVLSYDSVDGFDEVARYWLKSITMGLEFLRMKSDIRYLLGCQNLADYRDVLTGMYNFKGLERTFGAIRIHNEKTLYMVMLRTCLFKDEISDIETGRQTDAILDASKAIGQFCGKHDIAAYLNNGVFVCLVQSHADAEVLSDLLCSILAQHSVYMEYAGMDSFVCCTVETGNQTFSDLLAECEKRCEQLQNRITSCRSAYRYHQLLRIRNDIYANPEKTFVTDTGLINGDDAASFRLHYRNCFGISFRQDCIAARLAKAKYYLVTTSITMSDVAEKCGYMDKKYFLRQFPTIVGIPAAKFRTLIKG
ncbi:MAG: substrate-binding domain-containing protein [Oscillospiraceae bacterium]|nr:substrate-binding domain-containing protein [Oscillospiraceae bacterium]